MKKTSSVWPCQFLLIDSEEREFEHVLIGHDVWTGSDLQPNLPVKKPLLLMSLLIKVLGIN